MDAILPGIWRWESRDEEGVAMVSYAIEEADTGTLILDPAWDADAVTMLERLARPLRIVVSTGNHVRDARRYRSRLAVPVAASAATARDMEDANRVLEPEDRLPGGWTVVAAPGVYDGEIALYRERRGRGPSDVAILYVGDAVLGIGDDLGSPETGGQDGDGPGKAVAGRPDPLTLLPERLVADPARLRDTLSELSRLEVDVLLLGHGRPVITGAGQALAQLLRR